jgi:putative oxidoreductase
MNALSWVAQTLLLVGFGMAGFMKVTAPVDQLHQALPYTADLPLALVRFIGISEIAGALGVMLPAITRIRPSLTPLAATGLTTVMVLAALFHVGRGEFLALPINVVLGGLAALVAWIRLRVAPLAPRSRDRQRSDPI